MEHSSFPCLYESEPGRDAEIKETDIDLLGSTGERLLTCTELYERARANSAKLLQGPEPK